LAVAENIAFAAIRHGGGGKKIAVAISSAIQI